VRRGGQVRGIVERASEIVVRTLLRRSGRWRRN
jgi:hypothetical protein